LSPAGARALLVFASVPESSEIFSSCKRDEAGFESSWQYDGGVIGERFSEFMGDLQTVYYSGSIETPGGKFRSGKISIVRIEKTASAKLVFLRRFRAPRQNCYDGFDIFTHRFRIHPEEKTS
jgi:hypothetical protein